jgi:hypothetical protein
MSGRECKPDKGAKPSNTCAAANACASDPSEGSPSVPTKSRTFLPLVVVGMLVLIVASMYWARQIFIPVALAMLLSFLLNPVDRALQPSVWDV